MTKQGMTYNQLKELEKKSFVAPVPVEYNPISGEEIVEDTLGVSEKAMKKIEKLRNKLISIRSQMENF